MISFVGCGLTFYGWGRNAAGERTATLWVTAFFLPVLPLETCVVEDDVPFAGDPYGALLRERWIMHSRPRRRRIRPAFASIARTFLSAHAPWLTLLALAPFNRERWFHLAVGAWAVGVFLYAIALLYTFARRNDLRRREASDLEALAPERCRELLVAHFVLLPEMEVLGGVIRPAVLGRQQEAAVIRFRLPKDRPPAAWLDAIAKQAAAGGETACRRVGRLRLELEGAQPPVRYVDFSPPWLLFEAHWGWHSE